MDEKIEQEIIDVLDEQAAMKATEKLAGNVVKEEFHKGAIFGIKLVVNILAAQPTESPLCECKPGPYVASKDYCMVCGKDIR